MKQTRQNVFETNISSTHSISIANETKGVLMDTIVVNSEGIVEIDYGACDVKLHYEHFGLMF